MNETYLTRRKVNPVKENEKKKRKDSIKKVSLILRKCESLRTPEEKILLESFSDVTKQIKKRRERIQLYKDRIIEKEDSKEVINKKSEKLAEIISKAKHLVCFTGAGISTSAKIPDYRGTNGIWTLLQQGKEIEKHDLSLADPTYTHMALYELHRRNILRYVVSQNCDGLHLRAGLPRRSLSEVHGNMYIEVCKNCKPNVEYWRLFDTTEFTARFNHKTKRRCHVCHKPLIDSIVHFGERGMLKWPLNWDGACKHSEEADVILCLGSSLKVLKKYSWLWQMDRPKNKRAKICIINLQWTSKDKIANLKINGKCDDIMKLIMIHLNIATPTYSRLTDPIFSHASNLCFEELHTVSQPMLKVENYRLSAANVLPTDMINNGQMLKRPLIKNPINKQSFVKTNLNSRHFLENEGNSFEDNKTENNSSSCTNKIDIKLNGETVKFTSHCTNQKLEFANSVEDNDLENKNNNSDNLNSSCIEKKYLNFQTNFSSDILIDKINYVPDSNYDQSTYKNSYDKKEILSKLMDPCDIYLGYIRQNFSNLIHKPSILKDTQSSLKASNNTIIDNNGICDVEHKSPKCFMKLYDFNTNIEKLPNWYEVSYAYSGLHSIIKPPPPEINLWSSNIVPVYKMKRENAECQFCFNNYAEMFCQFYQNISSEFLGTKFSRRGKIVVCECCDYSDCEDIDIKNKSNWNDKISEEISEKQAKLDIGLFNQPPKEIQAGWFGKGYRKTQRKKKR